MSHFNQHLKASNPTYPSTYAYEYDYPDMTGSKAFPGFVERGVPECPAVGPYDCSNGAGKDDFFVQLCEDQGYTSTDQWDLAIVTEVYGTKYAANAGLPDYIESKATGLVCYPNDANSVDKRDPSGRGACHTMNGAYQDYVCNDNDSKCLSKESSKCECQYSEIPNEGDGVGQWIVDNGEGTCGKIR